MDKENGVPEKQACGKVGEEIVYCIDGKYRWTYEFDLLKNPSILFVILKIFLSVMLGILVFVTLFDIGRPDYFWTGFLANLKIFGIILLATVVISVLGYLLYAAMMGGKYCVLFEMDEKGVLHRQMEKQVRKAELISSIAALAASSPTLAGAALNSASRSEMYSEFSKVRSLKPYKKRCLIKVNETFEKNQVYVSKADFDFVYSFISKRCTGLKGGKNK